MAFQIRKSKLRMMIEEGEHQQQDFKFAVTDSKKIARSLAAFANTDGGRLLLGVKDNGAIVGVKSDEEFYMIEAAAQLYCKPEVSFSVNQWYEDGKSVLEIVIPKSDDLHAAPNKDGFYKVYTRVDDQNLLVNKVYIDAFRKRQRSGLILRITKPVEFLIRYLSTHDSITFSTFCRKISLKKDTAHRILSHLVALDIIHIHFTEKTAYYTLNHASMSENEEVFRIAQ